MRKTLSERSSLATLSDDTFRVATPNVTPPVETMAPLVPLLLAVLVAFQRSRS